MGIISLPTLKCNAFAYFSVAAELFNYFWWFSIEFEFTVFNKNHYFSRNYANSASLTQNLTFISLCENVVKHETLRHLSIVWPSNSRFSLRYSLGAASRTLWFFIILPPWKRDAVTLKKIVYEDYPLSGT